MNLEDDFKRKWYEHIDALNRLKFTLNKEDWSELDTVSVKLVELVDKASLEIGR